MRPWSITRMRLHDSTVASRCAITMVVRPCINRSSAVCTRVSLSASSEDVASSSSRSGAARRMARALAARQRDAALPDQCVEALWKALDELGSGRELGRAHDVGVARIRAAETDIVLDARAEYRDILRHKRDAGTQLPRVGGIEPH